MPTREDIVARGALVDRHAVSPPGVAEGRRLRLPGLLIGVWREVRPRSALRLRELAIRLTRRTGRRRMGARRWPRGWRKYLDAIEPKDAREGDIVLFRWRAHLPAKHAGILTAPDSMVHAQEKAAVSEVALSDWWRRRMALAFSLSGYGADVQE